MRVIGTVGVINRGEADAVGCLLANVRGSVSIIPTEAKRNPRQKPDVGVVLTINREGNGITGVFTSVIPNGAHGVVAGVGQICGRAFIIKELDAGTTVKIRVDFGRDRVGGAWWRDRG